MDARFLWAFEVLQIQPTDEILEIGCGSGIMLQQIASTLKEGRITAVDKSEAMIKLAAKRVGDLTNSDQVELIVSPIEKVDLKDRLYDVCFSFNVSTFFKNPDKGLSIIRNHLKPEGAFYQFYQPAYDITSSLCEKAVGELITNNFSIEEVIIEKKFDVPAFCIISKPSVSE